MKKLVLIFLVYIFVLTGCGNQVKPVPTPTKEQAAQIEQPTEPPVVETEEPTETMVPTEEPTAEPTSTEEPMVEPTIVEELLPGNCSSENLEVADSEDLVLDLGKHGQHDVMEVPISTKAYIKGQTTFLHIFWTDELKALLSDGQLSFHMPSPGMLGGYKAITIKVEDQLWENRIEGDMFVAAMSPEGRYIVPAGSVVTVELDDLAILDNPETPLISLFVMFLHGDAINGDSLSLPDMSTLVKCEEMWEVEIVNSTEESISIPVEIGHFLLIKDFDNLGSISYFGEEVMSDEIQKGALLFNEEVITLLPQGRITFLLFDLYPIN